MRLNEIEARMAELDNIVSYSEDIEEVKKAVEERKALESEKATLIEEAKKEEERQAQEEVEKRTADAALLSHNPGLATIIEEKRGEIKMNDAVEIRNSKEYINAFAEYIKTGDDTEVRSLLTTNGGGTVAVPQIVLDEVKTAWERNSILNLITNKFEAEGNIAQQFEISGDDATIHIEGSGAVSEEALSLGIATLVPDEIIKWIDFSKSVYAMRGEAFLRYIYREISHKIMKALVKKLIQQIIALPSSANSTTPSAAKIKKAAAVGTVSEAYANLCDDADNPVVVINKLTHATMKAAAYANGYSVDPFEGLDVRYNDTLPAYDSALENDVWMIVGDFGYGCVANFPNGQVPDVTIDMLTKKKSGMIEACGDLLGGAIPCACKAFTLVTKPASV